jgi:hypothetical protein
VVLVGTVLEEKGTETVKGTTPTLLLLGLVVSVAVTTIGKFWRGWAKTLVCRTKRPGAVTVERGSVKLSVVPIFCGSEDVAMDRVGDVPGLAFTDTCAVTAEEGVIETGSGDTRIENGAAASTAKEKVAE